jgi:tRNA G46 methylase TrmB
MLAGQASSYDEVPYAENCFHYTHPDHLAAIGTVFGMTVAPPDGCRLLELGCAQGGNIIPMALEHPEARFVGIDLSSRQIAEGRSVVERLGLQNLDLRAMSIMDVTPTLGSSAPRRNSSARSPTLMSTTSTSKRRITPSISRNSSAGLGPGA